ncbi:bifunctional methylenetetrahydrofolate dehydrogenase/methenyltetrahydrofolate cyclohydrolase FolD [Selenomonas sp. KH1T6]|uniref:bifunctional methylenetetrahydrofolate dehydrogenase/methenyltetrahydrofolate cyclohydrolase FolD n=1 Tax=Selenomonas sp. KH1T6 TaxID=3158784 RepID=UPI0008A7BD46|nr:methylenetetrahydrofolate dehydrogenase (NADP+) / methenyltetrahydrofolate cyclohydrolase [Selenomonas ruminantium]
MSARILEGKVFAGQFKEDARKRAAALKEKYGVQPGLAVIIVGHDPASEVYVRNKHKACEELGIYSEVIEMAEDSSKEEILARIDSLNKDAKIHGILVQLPLPKALRSSEEEILDSIDPVKDVDGFHPVNVGRMVKGEEALLPCTPHGCLKMLELAGIEIEGKKAVVVGRSNIVGKPMLHLLLARNATVTICHSRTENLPAVTREADILVAAVGCPKFITADMVKEGATVIDVGINRLPPAEPGAKGKLVGDVDFEAALEVAGAITPVPGGVGLLTVAMLMENVVQAAEMQLA